MYFNTSLVNTLYLAADFYSSLINLFNHAARLG
jgi:hypothetical protein